MKKRLATLFLSGAIAISTLSTVFAGTWLQDHVGWWYQNDDGTYPANGWHWIDGNNDGNAECYYFNEVGYCLINTTTPDGYMVDVNGAWIVDGMIQTKVVTAVPAAVTTTTTVTATEESSWSANMPYVSGMLQNKPTDGSFWTVNINTGKYHGTSYVENLLPENTRYYAGDAAALESNGYSRCKKRGCY